MRKIIETKCINCGNYYLKLEEKNTSGHGIKDAKIRSSNALTCSPKCSKEYNSLPTWKREELKKQKGDEA